MRTLPSHLLTISRGLLLGDAEGCECFAYGHFNDCLTRLCAIVRGYCHDGTIALSLVWDKDMIPTAVKNIIYKTFHNHCGLKFNTELQAELRVIPSYVCVCCPVQDTVNGICKAEIRSLAAAIELHSD